MSAAPTLHLRFPKVTPAALERELDRELAQRRRFYQGRVDKGNMTPAERDRGIAVAEAWRADTVRILAAWVDRPGTPPTEALHAVSWRDRTASLRREIDSRRRLYPEWIAGGRLTAADAAHQVDCLECLLAIYDDGFDWRASNGERPQFGLLETTREIDQARLEWDEHAAAVDQARGQQKELAL